LDYFFDKANDNRIIIIALNAAVEQCPKGICLKLLVLPAAERRGEHNDHRREYTSVRWINSCTPGMGVNLWGVSPLYVNPANVKYIGTSTSRRQGRNREGPSKGSRSAKL